MLALLLAITLCLPLLPNVQASAGQQDLPEIRSYADTGFTDVQDDWSKPSIVAAYEMGLMNGKGNPIFDPDGSVAIAEVVMAAALLHNLWLGKGSARTAGTVQPGALHPLPGRRDPRPHSRRRLHPLWTAPVRSWQGYSIDG